MKRIHCKISGRVQGVFFRASTRDEANRLQLRGWVKNLLTGEVEVFAIGEDRSVDRFVDWLQKGSPMAKVENIEFIQDENNADEKSEGFIIR